jgi:hypothetical protein
MFPQKKIASGRGGYHDLPPRDVGSPGIFCGSLEESVKRN